MGAIGESEKHRLSYSKNIFGHLKHHGIGKRALNLTSDRGRILNPLLPGQTQASPSLGLRFSPKYLFSAFSYLHCFGLGRVKKEMKIHTSSVLESTPITWRCGVHSRASPWTSLGLSICKRGWVPNRSLSWVSEHWRSGSVNPAEQPSWGSQGRRSTEWIGQVLGLRSQSLRPCPVPGPERQHGQCLPCAATEGWLFLLLWLFVSVDDWHIETTKKWLESIVLKPKFWFT